MAKEHENLTERLDLQALALKVADKIREELPEGTGFIMILVDPDNMAYTANFERPVVIDMLRDWVGRLERAEDQR